MVVFQNKCRLLWLWEENMLFTLLSEPACSEVVLICLAAWWKVGEWEKDTGHGMDQFIPACTITRKDYLPHWTEHYTVFFLEQAWLCEKGLLCSSVKAVSGRNFWDCVGVREAETAD